MLALQVAFAAAALQPKEQQLEEMQAYLDGQVCCARQHLACCTTQRACGVALQRSSCRPQLRLARVACASHAQDRELLAGRTALLAAQRAAGDKSAAASTLKQEVWQAKQAIAKQAALLDAVAHDIFNVSR